MAMDILVDTSVWIDHFRNKNTHLIHLITAGSVLTHPFIVGEIACGSPPNRLRTLKDLAQLKLAQEASAEEVLKFVQEHLIYGKGCGLTDITLLASVHKTTNSRIWTIDKRLQKLAVQFDLAYFPPATGSA